MVRKNVVFALLLSLFLVCFNGEAQNVVVSSDAEQALRMEKNKCASQRIKELEFRQYLYHWVMFLGGISILALAILIRKAPRKAKLSPIQSDRPDSVHMRRFVENYFKGQDEERDRIGKELHDGPCSTILGIRAILNSQVDENEDIRKASDWLQSLHIDLRNMSHNLSPKELCQYNLLDALQILLNRLCTDSGRKFVFLANGKMDWKTTFRFEQHTIYRVVQEVLGNVTKHSNATQVDMSVFITDRQITLNIEDNCTNFEIKTGSGHGVENIKARLNLMNGKITTEITPKGAVQCIEAFFKQKPSC